MRHKGVGKFFPRPGQNIISLLLLLPKLQAQTSAALGAAAGQNLAAILGGHTAAKTVDLGVMTLVGLIGTNHVLTPPKKGEIGKLVPSATGESNSPAVSVWGLRHPRRRTWYYKA